MTVFSVHLQSVKKIGDADVVVGVAGGANEAKGPLTVIKREDPNVSHPLRQTDVVRAIGALRGKPFTTHVFQAVAWKHGLKQNPQYCWKASEGVLTKYSHDVIAFAKRLSANDLDAAKTDYGEHLRKRAKARKTS